MDENMTLSVRQATLEEWVYGSLFCFSLHFPLIYFFVELTNIMYNVYS